MSCCFTWMQKYSMQWATVGDMLALPSLTRNSYWDTMIGRSSARDWVAPKLAFKKKKFPALNSLLAFLWISFIISQTKRACLKGSPYCHLSVSEGLSGPSCSVWEATFVLQPYSSSTSRAVCSVYLCWRGIVTLHLNEASLGGSRLGVYVVLVTSQGDSTPWEMGCLMVVHAADKLHHCSFPPGC